MEKKKKTVSRQASESSLSAVFEEYENTRGFNEKLEEKVNEVKKELMEKNREDVQKMNSFVATLNEKQIGILAQNLIVIAERDDIEKKLRETLQATNSMDSGYEILETDKSNKSQKNIESLIDNVSHTASLQEMFKLYGDELNKVLPTEIQKKLLKSSESNKAYIAGFMTRFGDIITKQTMNRNSSKLIYNSGDYHDTNASNMLIFHPERAHLFVCKFQIKNRSFYRPAIICHFPSKKNDDSKVIDWCGEKFNVLPGIIINEAPLEFNEKGEPKDLQSIYVKGILAKESQYQQLDLKDFEFIVKESISTNILKLGGVDGVNKIYNDLELQKYLNKKDKLINENPSKYIPFLGVYNFASKLVFQWLSNDNDVKNRCGLYRGVDFNDDTNFVSGSIVVDVESYQDGIIICKLPLYLGVINGGFLLDHQNAVLGGFIRYIDGLKFRFMARTSFSGCTLSSQNFIKPTFPIINSHSYLGGSSKKQLDDMLGMQSFNRGEGKYEPKYDGKIAKRNDDKNIKEMIIE